MLEVTVSIFRREGRKNFEMQYRDPRTGKKVRRTTGQATRSKALKAAGEWERELRDGLYKRPEKTTWDEFRERYEEEALANDAVAPATELKVSGVFNAIERLIAPRLLTDLDGNALASYPAKLRKDEVERRNGKLVVKHRGRSECTIAGHLAHLHAALNWAVSAGMLRELPTFPSITRAKSSRRKRRYSKMKGRPITAEEFDRFVAAVPKALTMKPHKQNKAPTKPTAAQIASWEYLIRGLWLSGLRLGEAMELHWTDESQICVRLEGRRPMLWIPGELQKSAESEVYALAPEFAEFLLATPSENRQGFVFNPLSGRKHVSRMGLNHVSKRICEIGQAAGIKVNTDAKGKVKFASAHDLRRSFGERWAPRVMPTVLQELMRHTDIATTMSYYVTKNAETMADVLWAAYSSETANLGNLDAAIQEANGVSAP